MTVRNYVELFLKRVLYVNLLKCQGDLTIKFWFFRPTCPVCNTSLKESDLKKDDKLQRKVWKAKKQEKKNRASKEGVVKL